MILYCFAAAQGFITRCGLINDAKIIMLTFSLELYSSTVGAQQGFFSPIKIPIGAH